MKAPTRRGHRRTVLGTAFLIAALAAAGCDAITDTTGRYADDARIELSGTSPGPLVLVSSTHWVYAIDENTGFPYVHLYEADTTEVELPAEKNVALAPRYRILFRVINPHAEEANIRMRVLLDGELKYDAETPIGDMPVDYTFRFQ